MKMKSYNAHAGIPVYLCVLALITLYEQCNAQIINIYNLHGGTPVRVESRNKNGVEVPKRVTATITRQDTGGRRTTFPSTNPIKGRMIEMSAQPGDEKGHIIGKFLKPEV